MLRAAARAVIVSRCVRGIDARGLHVTNLEALRTALLARGPRRARSASSTASACPTSARAARRDRRRLPQRRDRRGVGAGEGHAATATCAAPPSATPAGTSRPTSATRPPSTAPRSPPTASRRCTACRSSRSPTSSWRSAARPTPGAGSERVLECSRPSSRPPASSSRRSRRSAAPGAAAACGARARASHSRGHPRGRWRRLRAPIDVERPERGRRRRRRPGLDLAEDERSARRRRRGRARRSGCGSCGRSPRSPRASRCSRGEPLAEGAEPASRVVGHAPPTLGARVAHGGCDVRCSALRRRPAGLSSSRHRVRPRVSRPRLASAAMLASVATFALEGVDSREVTVEVDVRRGLPAFTARRAARPRRARGARARARRAAELRPRVPAAAHHRRTSRPRTCARPGRASTSRSPSACSPRAARCPPRRSAGTRRLRRALARRRAAAGRAARSPIALGARQARLPAPDRARRERRRGGAASRGSRCAVSRRSAGSSTCSTAAGRRSPPAPLAAPAADASRRGLDLADVRGQADAKRALEIAAAGGHNLLMVGPPGAGKTMLARRLPGDPAAADARRGARDHPVHSVAGRRRRGGWRPSARSARRTTRSRRRASSAAARRPRPGEVTLAHRGVLFLDELAEFSRRALEALRQPLEDGRGRDRARPARRSRSRRARCSSPRATPARARRPPGAVRRAPRWSSRATGAGSAGRCSTASTSSARSSRAPPPSSCVEPRRGRDAPAAVRERVVAARERQGRGSRAPAARCNAEMDAALTRRRVRAGRGAARRACSSAREPASLSGRGHDRVLRVARTIADLDGRDARRRGDLDEALGYRAGRPDLRGRMSAGPPATPACAARAPDRAARRPRSPGCWTGRPRGRRPARALPTRTWSRRSPGRAPSRRARPLDALRPRRRAGGPPGEPGRRGLPAPAGYPPRLRDLADPPAVLFSRRAARARAAP